MKWLQSDKLLNQREVDKDIDPILRAIKEEVLCKSFDLEMK